MAHFTERRVFRSSGAPLSWTSHSPATFAFMAITFPLCWYLLCVHPRTSGFVRWFLNLMQLWACAHFVVVFFLCPLFKSHSFYVCLVTHLPLCCCITVLCDRNIPWIMCPLWDIFSWGLLGWLVRTMDFFGGMNLGRTCLLQGVFTFSSSMPWRIAFQSWSYCF